jgi:uncharacterized protein (TIGR00730 family)
MDRKNFCEVNEMSKRYYVCVYGGASERIDAMYIKEVEKLGKVIVENGYSLVFGAGATGCMGAVARGVTESEGYVMGISPYFMGDFEEIYDCDNTVIVETMSERKTLMEKHGDVFVIAPGGIGTMDEFFQVITLKYLKRLDRPIVILNYNGFYDKLLELMDDLVKNKAVIDNISEYYDVITSADDPKFTKILKNVKNK